jgi:hypothetical protein
MLFSNSYRKLERWIIAFAGIIGISFIFELALGKSYGKIQKQQIRIDDTLNNIFDSFFSKCHVALKYQK